MTQFVSSQQWAGSDVSGERLIRSDTLVYDRMMRGGRGMSSFTSTTQRVDESDESDYEDCRSDFDDDEVSRSDTPVIENVMFDGGMVNLLNTEVDDNDGKTYSIRTDAEGDLEECDNQDC